MPGANPLRGEADLGGQKLVVNNNSLCALESALGLEGNDVIALLGQTISFTQLRTFVRVLAESDLSEEDAGDLIDEAGGYRPAADAINKAVQGYFKPQIKGNSARPLKAA